MIPLGLVKWFLYMVELFYMQWDQWMKLKYIQMLLWQKWSDPWRIEGKPSASSGNTTEEELLE